jgi:hypothetical protein
MERQFEDWFREEAAEKGRVIWEASEEDIEGFLAAQRKPIPIPPTVQAPPVRLPDRPTIKPTVELPRVRVTSPTQMAAPFMVPERKATPSVPETKGRARIKLPAGVFESIDDVRRGIIMSEILEPPVSMR